uniref:Ferritin n=1 Tax=Cyprinus carpio TaxID=7962 RepID=A0A8C2I0B7_CYPCA
METSQIRQNYDRDCEALINKMINLELYAGYTYTSMVSVSYCSWSSRT